jgi:hypothetical protein
MNEVLLDRKGTIPHRDGYSLVMSEVEFLKLAVGNDRLQVRGAICDWAQTFCEARLIACREMLSPIAELGGLCAELDKVKSERIVDVIGNQKFDTIERPLSIGKVLNAIYRGNLWDKEPSIRHAAEWLLWLIEFQPEEYLRPLLRQISKLWLDIFQNPERVAYSITDAKSALSVLNGWLGITHHSDYVKWGEFPLIVPVLVKSRAREYWNRQIVETKGAWLDADENWPAQNALKKALAEEAYKYFKKYPANMTQERFDCLAAFLSWQDQQELQISLPPKPVSEMPKEPEAVLNWFLKEYLPYRRWQFGKNDEDAEKNLNEKARSFSFWYLDNYPKALSGADMRRFISFDRAASVAKNSEKLVTLVIVLDGLHVGDAHSLHLKIQELAPRLSLVSDDLVFTALPTVTEFCKEALFKGVPPVQTEKVQPIGTIIPESETPISRLTTANTGEVLFWRIQEPDHTYHSKNKFDALIRKVEAELDSVAKIVQDIVEQVPSDVPLQVIVTTDHGRLIAISKRKHPIPQRMESHGRASWGYRNKEFGYEGYCVEGDIVFMGGERYGLAFDVAVPLTDEAFITSDGKSGQEAFTHGGLYPEEVIIPWITFVRDFVKPKVEVKVTGHASAGKAGTLIITSTNLSDVDITLSNIELNIGSIHEQRKNLEFRISRMSSEEFKLEIQKWPTNEDIRKSHCVCQIKQLNGLVFNLEGTLDIQSDEMYLSENILEDLS